MLKTCRCGIEIEYEEKHCESCAKEVAISKKESYKRYALYRQQDAKNKARQMFYSSKDWIMTRDKAKFRFNGLCIVCLLDHKEITYSDLVHHIYTTEEYWGKRLDINNLICVCNSCHAKIHYKYDRSEVDKEIMMDKLLILVRDYNKGEYSI